MSRSPPRASSGDGSNAEARPSPNTSQILTPDFSERFANFYQFHRQTADSLAHGAVETHIVPVQSDTEMPDRISSPPIPMSSDISAALDIQSAQPQRSLETLIRDVLPAELKVMVLKEVLRLWATKIPLMSLKCNPRYNKHSKVTGFYEVTNRAVLAFIIVPRSSRRRNRGQEKQSSRWLGWCAIPAGRQRSSYLKFGTINSRGEGPFQTLTMESRKSWSEHPIRLSNILASTAFSKELHPIMENFFLGHTIWEFNHVNHFEAIMRQIRQGDSREMLSKIKNISISLGFWYDFVGLFETIFKTFKKDNPFPKIESLELDANFGLMKCQTQGVIDENVRFHYLVTRCYQLVRLFPRLTICLRGASCCTSGFTLEPDVAKYISFGFTEEQMVQFEKGIFEDVQKLPSFDYHIDHEMAMATSLDKVAETQWKMKFAQEWRKIWAEGIDTHPFQGGYAAVFDPRKT